MDLSALEPFRRRIYTIIFIIGWSANIVAWLLQSAQGNTTPAINTLFLVGLVVIPLLVLSTWLPGVALRLVDMLTVSYVAAISAATISINFYVDAGNNLAALESVYMWVPVMYIFTFSITSRKTALWISLALWLTFFAVSLPYLVQHIGSPKAHTNIQFQFMSALFITAFYFFASYQQRLRLANLSVEEFATLANTDSLTQIANRRRMLELMKVEFLRFSRYQHVFSIVIIDIDHFKQFNDSHGHAVGDSILKALAQRLQAVLRDVDTLARWGGEEFIVMLPETRFDEAITKADAIREHIASQPLVNEHLITLSCGVTEVAADDSLDSIFKRADDALYQAKNNGRNRVEGLSGRKPSRIA